MNMVSGNGLPLVIQGAVGLSIPREKSGVLKHLVDSVTLRREFLFRGNYRLRTFLSVVSAWRLECGRFEALFSDNGVFRLFGGGGVVGFPSSSDSLQGFSQFCRLFDV